MDANCVVCRAGDDVRSVVGAAGSATLCRSCRALFAAVMRASPDCAYCRQIGELFAAGAEVVVPPGEHAATCSLTVSERAGLT